MFVPVFRDNLSPRLTNYLPTRYALLVLLSLVAARDARAQFTELRTPFEKFTDWRILISASTSTPPNSQWDENGHVSQAVLDKQLNFNQMASVEYGEFRVGAAMYSIPSSIWPFVVWNPKFNVFGWHVGGDTNRWALSLRGENLFASNTGNEFLGKGQSDKSNYPDRNSFSFLVSCWLGSEPDSAQWVNLFREADLGETNPREDALGRRIQNEVRFAKRGGLSFAVGLGTGKYAGTGPLSRYINFLSSYDPQTATGFSGISPLLAIRYRLRNLIAQLDFAGEDINLHFVLRNLRRLDIETGVLRLEHLFPRSTRGPHRPEAFIALRYGINTTDTSDVASSLHEYGDGIVDTKRDHDADGLLDGDEILSHGTDPMRADTDADGLLDGDEVKTKRTDPLRSDTDGDGLNDGEEANKYRTAPRNRDTDGDGLIDGDEVAIHKTKPLGRDTDGDGLNDGDEVAAAISPLNSDSDGDGLSDGEEVENGTSPKLPDTDGDDLNDKVELKDMETNPLSVDTDGDGVRDNKDGCPKVPGQVENDGCPPKLQSGSSLDIVGIEFETGKAVILPQSLDAIMKADSILRLYPMVRVSIEGHTDNVGDPDFNLRLSLERAQSVRDYLISRGIEPARLQAQGYGQERPITTNMTEEGRAINRRIEFIVVEDK